MESAHLLLTLTHINGQTFHLRIKYLNNNVNNNKWWECKLCKTVRNPLYIRTVLCTRGGDWNRSVESFSPHASYDVLPFPFIANVFSSIYRAIE